MAIFVFMVKSTGINIFWNEFMLGELTTEKLRTN
jgi:hypothetical protein